MPWFGSGRAMGSGEGLSLASGLPSGFVLGSAVWPVKQVDDCSRGWSAGAGYRPGRLLPSAVTRGYGIHSSHQNPSVSAALAPCRKPCRKAVSRSERPLRMPDALAVPDELPTTIGDQPIYSSGLLI